MSLSLSPPAVTSLLVPAYIYPLADAWDPLFSAVAAHPSTPMYIIINPDSGPDGSAPNSDYAAAVGQLNAAGAATTLLGYVHTSYAQRALADVEADVAAYAAWAQYAAANASLAGIFFDEAPATADAAALAYMRAAAAAVKTSFAAGRQFVVFNPGTQVESQSYFDYADAVVVYESPAAGYDAGVFAAQGADTRQEAGILNAFGGTDAQLQTLVQGAVNAKAGLFYVTENYESWPSYLGTLVADLATAIGRS